MCVIIRKPKGKKLSERLIKKAWERNSHGGGFIIVGESGNIFAKKALMTYDDFIHEVDPYLGEKYDLVAHLRIQSRGGTKPELTHPFSTQYFYIVHNGTVKLLNESKLNGESDSSYLVEHILNESKVSHEGTLTILKNLNANKQGKFIAVCKTTGEVFPFMENSLFGHDEKSFEEDGILWSNGKHLTYDATKGPLIMGDGVDYDYYNSY